MPPGTMGSGAYGALVARAGLGTESGAGGGGSGVCARHVQQIHAATCGARTLRPVSRFISTPGRVQTSACAEESLDAARKVRAATSLFPRQVIHIAVVLIANKLEQL